MGDEFSISYIKGKHEFFPIPELEMQKSPGLVQYEGWR